MTGAPCLAAGRSPLASAAALLTTAELNEISADGMREAL